MTLLSTTYTDDQLVALLRRSYLAVDGLWFVKCEQELGFDRALELDDQVWQVMPKIQARQARAVLGVTGHDLADLARCLGLKLTAEGHQFTVDLRPGELTFRIVACPWRAVLEKADRLPIAAQIGERICREEAAGWAAEFGGRHRFEMAECLCDGGGECRFVFLAADQEETL